MVELKLEEILKLENSLNIYKGTEAWWRWRICVAEDEIG